MTTENTAVETSEATNVVNTLASYTHTVKKNAAEKGGDSVVIGNVVVAIPTLSSFGIPAEVKEVGKDGIPVYTETAHNWLQRAVLNAALIKLRTTLQKDSIEVKPGKTLPDSLDWYINSDSDRSAVRKEKSEAIKLFGEWVASKGKPQNVVEYLTGAVSNVDSFKTQPEAKRVLVADALMKFIEETSASETVKFSNFQLGFMTDIVEVISKGDEVADDELAF